MLWEEGAVTDDVHGLVEVPARAGPELVEASLADVGDCAFKGPSGEGAVAADLDVGTLGVVGDVGEIGEKAFAVTSVVDLVHAPFPTAGTHMLGPGFEIGGGVAHADIITQPEAFVKSPYL